MNVPDPVKQALLRLPDRPGCYLMRDRRGTIIYVGKAASLRKRVQSYFRDASLRSASPKLRSLVHSVADLEFLTTRNEAEAVLTESRLIKEYRPRYNVSLRDDKRFLLIRADPGEPFPRLRLCRFERPDGARYFGPYASAAAARLALDFAEKKFGLRKCAPRVPDATTYRHCINDIVRYCSAPCVGRIGEADYRQRVEDASAFLRGEKGELLRRMREEMERLSVAMEFERAAALRDTLRLLERAVRQRARVRAGPALLREQARQGLDALRDALGLPAPPRLIEAYDVSNISGTHAVGSLVCFEDGMPRRNRYRRFRIRGEPRADDPRMLAEVVRRRFERLLREGGTPPDLVLVDGGPAQVAAAVRELRSLGAGQVAVAGLAKRFEELHRPGKGSPLRLAPGSPGLQVLQRLRDEAHRFALAYHLRLRGRRLRESALDEVPGIGPARKKALLERFGSVQRLRKATEDQIAAVPGIGYERARTILAQTKREDPPAASVTAGEETCGSSSSN